MFQLYQVQAVRPTTKFAAVVTLSVPALLHIALYMLVLEYAVPWLGRTAHVPAMQRYSEVAKIFPGNFFNMNPVHCLRSRYLHNHQPPCIFYQIGKEHLLEPNPKLGLFYSAPEWNNEKTSTFLELAQFARKSLGRALAMAHPRFALQESQEALTEGRDDQRLDSPQPSPEASGSGALASEASPQTAAGLGPARKTRKSMVTFAVAQADDEPE